MRDKHCGQSVPVVVRGCVGFQLWLCASQFELLAAAGLALRDNRAEKLLTDTDTWLLYHNSDQTICVVACS